MRVNVDHTGKAHVVPAEAPRLGAPTRIYLVVEEFWQYNDEYNYTEGVAAARNAHWTKADADRQCAAATQHFRDTNEPDDFVCSDNEEPDGWVDWTSEQKWDWLLGVTPAPEDVDGTTWNCVVDPFSVVPMDIPATALTESPT